MKSIAMRDALMTSAKKVDEGVKYFVPDIGKAAALCGMARRCFADTFSQLYVGRRKASLLLTKHTSHGVNIAQTS
jgi:hypothetical protein